MPLASRYSATFALLALFAVVTVPISAGESSPSGPSGPSGSIDPSLGKPPADRRIESSPDGLITVDRPLSEVEKPSVGTARGTGVPFATAPDWSNTLRRQIGGLAIADLNGDGRNELIAGCYSSNSFPPFDDWHNFIYFNGPSGLEADPSWISTDQVSTTEVAVADFNGDTFPDVVSATGATAGTVIYYGTATGPSMTPGWTSNQTAFTVHVAPFDVDHDGDIDLMTANQGFSQFDPFRPMYLHINDGTGLETVPSWQSSESSIQNYLHFGDYDGDGWEDLAVSKWANFESGVYKNVEGTLDTTPIWTTGDTDTDKGIGWADVDGNGTLDLALGHDPTQMFTNTAGVLTQTWSAVGTFFGQQELEWADVDLDGDPDIAEVHFGNGVVNIYQNVGGTPETTPFWSYDSTRVATSIAFGDLNNDGKIDLAIGYSGEPSIIVFYNQSANDVFSDGFESGNTSAWSLTTTP